eukprot:UN27422
MPDKDSDIDDMKRYERFRVSGKTEVNLRNILAYGTLYEGLNPDDSERGFNKVCKASDHVPIVGHLKALTHLIRGDTEHAKKSAINATLTTACMITGGLGAIAMAGGKCITESLIPATQSQLERRRSWDVNLKGAVSRAPIIGYGV